MTLHLLQLNFSAELFLAYLSNSCFSVFFWIIKFFFDCVRFLSFLLLWFLIFSHLIIYFYEHHVIRYSRNWFGVKLEIRRRRRVGTNFYMTGERMYSLSIFYWKLYHYLKSSWRAKWRSGSDGAQQSYDCGFISTVCSLLCAFVYLNILIPW